MARRQKVQAQLVAAKETALHSSEAANNEEHATPKTAVARTYQV